MSQNSPLSPHDEPNNSANSCEYPKSAAMLQLCARCGFGLAFGIMVGSIKGLTLGKVDLPWYVGPVVAGLLAGASIALANRTLRGRVQFLLTIPPGILAVSAAYPKILWLTDVPVIAVLCLLIYTPVAWGLTRGRVLLLTRTKKMNWISRGGPWFLIAALICVWTLSQIRENRNTMYYIISLQVLMIYYIAGLAAIGFSTRHPEKMMTARQTLIHRMRIACWAVFLVVALGVFLLRPDLKGKWGFEHTTRLHLSADSIVTQVWFKADPLEQSVMWAVEIPNESIIPILKSGDFKMILSPTSRTSDGWRFSFMMLRGDGILSRDAYNIGWRGGLHNRHLVLTSPDGRKSLHLVDLK